MYHFESYPQLWKHLYNGEGMECCPNVSLNHPSNVLILQVSQYLEKQLVYFLSSLSYSTSYDTIVIFGSPVNYVSRGFKSCKKYNVCIESGKYPAAMMVKELRPHALDCHKWVYQDSPVMAISEEEAERYDAALEPMEKKHLPSQEEFYIMSRSFVEG